MVSFTITAKGDRYEADLSYEDTHYYFYGFDYAGCLFKVGEWLQAKAFALQRTDPTATSFTQRFHDFARGMFLRSPVSATAWQIASGTDAVHAAYAAMRRLGVREAIPICDRAIWKAIAEHYWAMHRP